jgi:hypothetical protein
VKIGCGGAFFNVQEAVNKKPKPINSKKRDLMLRILQGLFKYKSYLFGTK